MEKIAINYFKRILALVLIYIFSATAFAKNQCTIKVGWMERPSYQYADKHGKPQGFDIEYMKAIAKDLSCISFSDACPGSVKIRTC